MTMPKTMPQTKYSDHPKNWQMATYTVRGPLHKVYLELQPNRPGETNRQYADRMKAEAKAEAEAAKPKRKPRAKKVAD
jgi:hypothetical protein